MVWLTAIKGSIASTLLVHSWYYEKKDIKYSPSIREGLDPERENRYRREGARFIINVGNKMGLRYDTMATGVVYFHRFYMFHSFKTFPRYVTACCCLFLAGKVEETPKKCKDIIKTAKSFLDESKFAQFGDDPKEEVMTLERILLQTIKFDLQVDHPYGYLLKYAKSLKGDKKKVHNMVQMAWTFINDSLCTTLCLQWEPEVIAIALMYLAGKLSKFEIVDWNGRNPKQNYWWDMFIEGLSVELLEDICHQVLDLYSMPATQASQDSPPATPPTKSTRKTSQPPSPIEATSPAQVRSKEPPIGQPIPRLEPGELKRKNSSLTDTKDTTTENSKIPRLVAEGKAIPTISNQSGKSSPKVDTQPSSPISPAQQDPVIKSAKEVPLRAVSEAVYKSGLTASKTQAFQQSSSYISTEATTSSKLPSHVPQVASTSFSVTIPPPTATYSQSAPNYFSDNQPFPNMQQPPPTQLFSQRPPVSYQHPLPMAPSGPPPPPPGLPLPHQYPPNLPLPFNSQFPPPRHQPPPPPPSIMPTAPPAPLSGITQHPPPARPPGAPPLPSMIRTVPPPPGVHPPVHHMPPPPESLYRTGSDMYGASDQRGRSSKVQDFGSRSQFEGNFRGRRDTEYDSPYPRDTGFRRPPPSKFGQDFQRSPHPNRRFSLEQQQRNQGPGINNPQQQQQGGPTGIPPVRITGSK